MKKISIPAIIAVTALFAAACSQNDEPNLPKDNFPADGVIRVATDVREPQTRAGKTSENITEFYLKVENGANDSYSYFALMKKEDGEWKSYDAANPTETLTMLWQNRTQQVTVSAASLTSSLQEHHWNEARVVSVRPDQRTVENLRASDALVMAPVSVDPATDLTAEGKLRVALKHRYAKLNLTVKLGTEFNVATAAGTTTNPITFVKVEGTNTACRWNIATDEMHSHNNLIPVSPLGTGYTAGTGETTQAVATYECILLPQSLAAKAFGVRITIDGKHYIWQHETTLALLKDTQYNLTLTVGKDVITMGGFSVTPWRDGATADVETE